MSASPSRQRELLLALMAAAEGSALSREEISGLVERHHGYLLALLRYKTGNEELSLDLLQETYLAFVRAATRGEATARLGDERRARNYLVTIALNKLRDHWRSTGRDRSRTVSFRDREALDECLDGLASAEPAPDEAFVEGTERERLAACTALAMERIGERYRLVLRLKFAEGLGNPAIAERTGLGIKAVESLLVRAKAAFRGEFEKLAVGANE